MYITLADEYIKKTCPMYTIEYYLATKIEIGHLQQQGELQDISVLSVISLAQVGSFGDSLSQILTLSNNWAGSKVPNIKKPDFTIDSVDRHKIITPFHQHIN